MRIETKLQEEIASELEELSKTEVGTDMYKTTVDGLTKLMEKAIEIERLDIELQEKEESRREDNEFRLKQMEEERKDRKIKNALTLVGIIVPTALTVWGTLKSIEFEKEGTITTIIGRGFFNKLLPKK